MRLIFHGKWLNIQSLPHNVSIMKNGSKFILMFIFWLFCLTKIYGSNLSLVLGYRLLVNNQTEIKISQVESSQPLAENNVSIILSNNMIIIKDTADKALLFSVQSQNDYQVLKLFKENCLDQLANVDCLDEFVEKFYTLFDPFGLEYQFYYGTYPMLAKLVKDDQKNELKISNQLTTGILHLRSPDKLIGPIRIYEISSGREVFSKELNNDESYLDLSNLNRGSYILVNRENRVKFVKL